MASRLDCVEGILNKHKNQHPRCEDVNRLDDTITCEHETEASERVPLLVTFRYNSKTSLMEIDKILDKRDLKDVTEKYKKHRNVKSAMEFINKEIREQC